MAGDLASGRQELPDWPTRLGMSLVLAPPNDPPRSVVSERNAAVAELGWDPHELSDVCDDAGWLVSASRQVWC